MVEVGDDLIKCLAEDRKKKDTEELKYLQTIIKEQFPGVSCYYAPGIEDGYYISHNEQLHKWETYQQVHNAKINTKTYDVLIESALDLISRIDGDTPFDDVFEIDKKYLAMCGLTEKIAESLLNDFNNR